MSAAIDPTADGSTLAVVQQAVARGWRPFPLDHPAHENCLSRRCAREREGWDGTTELDCPHGVHDKRGKHPVGHWPTQSAAQQSAAMLRMWFGNHPVNIGVACKPSGLVVLDEDELDALLVFAAELGQALPRTYRVRTSRGWHWYFKVPAGVVVGNRTGTLKARHIDVRGGKGDGGYVVAAGSTHWTGHVYVAEDETAPLADLPAWIVEQIQADSPSNATGNEFNPDDVRTGTREELEATYRHHLAQVTTPGFENSFFTAARDGYRMAALGMPLEHVHADLFLVVQRVWGAAPNAGDQKLLGQARTKAIESPWELRGQVLELRPMAPPAEATAPSEPQPTTANTPAGGEQEDTSYDPEEVARRAAEKREADEFAAELEKERRRRKVREHLAAEDREELVELDFDAFLSAPTPNYLIPKMLYRDGLACVFGPPGAAKSFLVLDLALSLATGTPWRGRDIGRGRVHYVMAEGQATNTLRTCAWLTHRDVDPSRGRGWFKTFPVPVMLTEAGVVDYLPKVVRDQPDLIILDTKNLMFAGKESQGEDFGAMLRVLHSMRRAAGGAAVVLIDHTGLTDDTRTRGSNAQLGGLDTEIRVTNDDGLRRVECTRDKSGAVGASWAFRLEQVECVPRPEDVDAPAVCVAADFTAPAMELNGALGGDWADSQVPLPHDVAGYTGVGASAVPAVARFMRHQASGGIGMTLAQMRKAVRAKCLNDRGKCRWADDTIDRAWGALAGELGRIDRMADSPMGLSMWVSRPDDPA